MVATEVSKASVALAQRNLANNDVDNVRVARGRAVVGSPSTLAEETSSKQARCAAEEFVDAMKGSRVSRLVAAGISLPGAEAGDGALAFDRLTTLFVDPPRARGRCGSPRARR